MTSITQLTFILIYAEIQSLVNDALWFIVGLNNFGHETYWHFQPF